MKFGENLYNLRKYSKLSQEKLAEKMDVSRQSISKWENGESYPEMEKMLKLCSIFHCKLNDLVHENMSDIDSLDEEIKMSVVKFKKEKQQKMKGLSKAIYVIARIGKIALSIGIGVIFFLMIFAPILIKGIDVNENEVIVFNQEEKLTIVEEELESGIEISIYEPNGDKVSPEAEDLLIKYKNFLENNSKGMLIVYVEIGMLFFVAAMILYRIAIKNLEELFVNIYNGDTPFTLENVNHIKKMAVLLIINILLPMVSELIFRIVLQMPGEVGFESTSIMEILFLFSMKYIFEYGYEIQKDSNGKIYGEIEE